MKITVEFTPDAGDVRVITFDDAANTATFNGVSSPLKRDGNVATVNSPNGVFVITVDSMVPEVGHTSRYSVKDRDSGVAKVLSIE